MTGAPLVLAWAAAILTAVGWFLVPVVCLSQLPMTPSAFWLAFALFWLVAAQTIAVVAWPHTPTVVLALHAAAGVVMIMFVLALARLFAAANERRHAEGDDGSGQHARDDR